MKQLRNIGKRVMAVVLCAVMLLGVLPVAAQAGTGISFFENGTVAYAENERTNTVSVETVTRKTRYNLLAGESQPIYNDRYVIVHNATNSVLAYDAVAALDQTVPNTPVSLMAGNGEVYYGDAVSDAGNPMYLYLDHHYRDAALWILLQTKSASYGTASIGNNTPLSYLTDGVAVSTYLGGSVRYHHTWLAKGNGPTLNDDGTVAATNNGAYWYSVKGNDGEGKQWRYLRLDEADMFGTGKVNTQIEKFPDDTYLIYYRRSSTAYHVLCRNESGTWGYKVMTPQQVAEELEDLKVRLYEYSYATGNRNLRLEGKEDFYFLPNQTNEQALEFIAQNIRVADADLWDMEVGCSGTAPKIGCYWLDGAYDSGVITVKYRNDNGTDTVIGTVNTHIVEEIPIGIALSALSGEITAGASGETVVDGCELKFTVNTADGEVERSIPLRLKMLSGGFSSSVAGVYGGLRVTYEGNTVCEDFTLTVLAKEIPQDMIRSDSYLNGSDKVQTTDTQRYYLQDEYIDPDDRNDRYLIVDHKSDAILGYNAVVDTPGADPNPTFTLDSGVLNGNRFYIPDELRDAALWIFQGRTDGAKLNSTEGMSKLPNQYNFLTLGSDYPAYRYLNFYKGMGADFNADGTVETNNGYYWHSIEGDSRLDYDGITQHRFMRLYDGDALFYNTASPEAFRLCIESFGDGTFLIYRANRKGTYKDHTDDTFYVLCHDVSGMADFGGGWGYKEFNGSEELMNADLDSLKLRLYKLYGGAKRYVSFSGDQNYYVTGSCEDTLTEEQVLHYIASNICVTASDANGVEDPFSVVEYDPAISAAHYYLEFDKPFDASIARVSNDYTVSIKYRNDDHTDTLVGTVRVVVEDAEPVTSLNLMDFGAAGDGTADDHEALQKAIDAASAGRGNGIIQIPAGTYRMDDFVILKSNITVLMDDDATIVNNLNYSSGPMIIFLTGPFTRGQAKQTWDGVENVTFIGGTVDMNGKLNEAGDGLEGRDLASSSSSFALGYSRNIRIEGVTFRNNYKGHVMQICACDGVVIKDCRFEGQSLPNFLTTNQMDNLELVQIEPSTVKGFPYAANNTGEASRNITIEGCYFGASDTCGEPSVAIGTHNQVVMGEKCYNIRIQNNVFDNMRHAAVRFCGFEDVTIRGNTFIKKTEAESINYRSEGCNLINVYCYKNTTDQLDLNKRIIIDNNSFRIADPLTCAIRVAKDSETYLGDVEDIAITNNTIENISKGSKNVAILALRISDGLTITGNTITGGYRGIELQSCMGSMTINSNVMTGLAYQNFRMLSCGTNQTIYFYTHGNGSMDVETSNGSYILTAVPNAGSTFAGYYKQNALTTLVSTKPVQTIPMNQSSNIYRHPLFEE